jgi:hypothetical protein
VLGVAAEALAEQPTAHCTAEAVEVLPESLELANQERLSRVSRVSSSQQDALGPVAGFHKDTLAVAVQRWLETLVALSRKHFGWTSCSLAGPEEDSAEQAAPRAPSEHREQSQLTSDQTPDVRWSSAVQERVSEKPKGPNDAHSLSAGP